MSWATIKRDRKPVTRKTGRWKTRDRNSWEERETNTVINEK